MLDRNPTAVRDEPPRGAFTGTTGFSLAAAELSLNWLKLFCLSPPPTFAWEGGGVDTNGSRVVVATPLLVPSPLPLGVRLPDTLLRDAFEARCRGAPLYGENTRRRDDSLLSITGSITSVEVEFARSHNRCAAANAFGDPGTSASAMQYKKNQSTIHNRSETR